MIYNQSLTLLTDLYQLTMAYGYWKTGIMEREAVFHLNFRKWPFKGSFAVMAGLESAIDFINSFKFEDSDLQYLSSLKSKNNKPLFEEGFLKYLEKFRFTVDIDALEEGDLVFPYGPLVRVKGPIIEAQLLETPLLNIINFQTLIATKAARVCLAADGDEVVEFGVRRAQGVDGAISASRAAYIGGCHASSNVLAGKLFGIPIKGTHAHSWVMAFEEEESAFEKYAKAMPHNCVMLVDTYNSIEGVKKAIEVAKKSKDENFEFLAVRLDSGDLAYLSTEIRKLLDESGFKDTKIMATNELDEHLIKDLKQQNAQITIWGVGTNLVTAKDQPALDGVYKLAAIKNAKGKWDYKCKLSEQTAKSTNPGILQVRRYFDGKHYVADALYDENFKIEDIPKLIHPLDPNRIKTIHDKYIYKDMLIPIYRKGKCVYTPPKLQDVRTKTLQELKKLKPSMLRFLNPEPYFLGLEKTLNDFKTQLIQEMKQS
ncbi:MAG: nicotinate phosphoribosyltransferase [Chlamydiota bacterium]|jgi:nicotinate phosphoribosyltransferase